jgi:hypothetical protein
MANEQSELIDRAIDNLASITAQVEAMQSRLDKAEEIIAKTVTLRNEQKRYFGANKTAWSYKEQILNKCKALEKELDEMIGQYRAPQTNLFREA